MSDSVSFLCPKLQSMLIILKALGFITVAMEKENV